MLDTTQLRLKFTPAATSLAVISIDRRFTPDKSFPSARCVWKACSVPVYTPDDPFACKIRECPPDYWLGNMPHKHKAEELAQAYDTRHLFNSRPTLRAGTAVGHRFRPGPQALRHTDVCFRCSAPTPPPSPERTQCTHAAEMHITATRKAPKVW